MKADQTGWQLARFWVPLLHLFLVSAVASRGQREPLTSPARVPEREPTEIVRALLSPDIQVRIEVLKEIGVPEVFRQVPPGPDYTDETKLNQVRLAFVNLDGDPTLEAIVTFDQQFHREWAAVLKQVKGGWLRIGLLHCWCKYERDPLTGFFEMRSLVDPNRYDLIVRDSLGGTGVYWRDTVIYRMKDNALHEVLRVREEYRECHLTPGWCDDTRSDLSFTSEQSSKTIIVSTVKGRIPLPRPERANSDSYPPLGDRLWHPVPQACQAYSWSASMFLFVPDKHKTLLYCESRKDRK